MKKGDKVNIFIDPVNETKLEGRATLVKQLRAASTDDRLEGWVVKFDGDASTVKRFIKAKEDFYPVKVGSLVKLKMDLLNCKKGEIGVVYELYKIGSEHLGASVIFANGQYDGFSIKERNSKENDFDVCFDPDYTGFLKECSDYHFINVMRLRDDYLKGYFDPLKNLNKEVTKQ